MGEEQKPNPLNEALFKVQHAIHGIKKDGNNPFTKSKYVTLDNLWDVVRPILEENQLMVMQFPTTEGDLLKLETRFVHVPSGNALTNTLSMALRTGFTPQDIGSAITYARRYSLAAMLGVVADPDDDGNASSGKTAPVKSVAIPAKSRPLPRDYSDNPDLAVPAASNVRIQRFGKAGLPVPTPVPTPATPFSRQLNDKEFAAFNEYMKQLKAEPWLIKRFLEDEMGIPEMRNITVAALRVIKERAEQGFFAKEQDAPAEA